MSITSVLPAKRWRQAGAMLAAVLFGFLTAVNTEGLIAGKKKKEPLLRPVVQESSGDGLNLTGLDDVIVFDLDGIAGAEQVTWVQRDADTGFFWLDLDNDGQIDGGQELFGTNTPASQGLPRSGFAALAMYDQPENGGNKDGVLSRGDTAWVSLRLWVDWNHNAQVDPGEVSSMADLHIQTIDLADVPLGLADPHGNYVLSHSLAHGEEGYDDYWVFDVLLQRAH
ncbi:MAG TPA: hypothetical protein PLS53_04315 [Thermoanaerobaculaceae bacterium]|nr:hypothetical protein [Thermoanaerobaculaceae bacterium]HPS77363.1 hypothetical protein [Thermoanaerobaculaceae bacterium]